MFFMPIPKLIHSFLHQFNSGTVKLVKIFFNYCIFFEYFAVNFLQKIRSGGWEKFPKIKKRGGAFIKHQIVLESYRLVSD